MTTNMNARHSLAKGRRMEGVRPLLGFVAPLDRRPIPHAGSFRKQTNDDKVLRKQITDGKAGNGTKIWPFQNSRPCMPRCRLSSNSFSF